jgi:hypothetical protein
LSANAEIKQSNTATKNAFGKPGELFIERAGQLHSRTRDRTWPSAQGSSLRQEPRQKLFFLARKVILHPAWVLGDFSPQTL